MIILTHILTTAMMVKEKDTDLKMYAKEEKKRKKYQISVDSDLMEFFED